MSDILETIGFADAQATCDTCGYECHYNYYKPYTCLEVCPECGDRLVPDHMKDTIKEFEEMLIRINKINKDDKNEHD